MKKEFLKMAGVENEKDFYRLFPTEEAFFGMYPEAKKLIQKRIGGELDKFRPGGFTTTPTTTLSLLQEMLQSQNNKVSTPIDNTYHKKGKVDPVLASGLNLKEGETIQQAYDRKKKELDEQNRKVRNLQRFNNAQHRKQILAERQARIKESDESPLNGFGIFNPYNWTRENWAKTAVADRMRFFPNSAGGWGHVFDDYINPFSAMIGSGADALARAPLQAKETGSIMPYVTSIGMPLLMGRSMGSGAINPLGKKFWTNTVSQRQFADNILMGVPSLAEAAGQGIVNKAVVPLARKIHGLPTSTGGLLSKGQLKEMRMVQDLMRSKALGNKSRDELINEALQLNISDDAFHKVFGFDKKQANSVLSGSRPQYTASPTHSSPDYTVNPANQLPDPVQEIDLGDLSFANTSTPSFAKRALQAYSDPQWWRTNFSGQGIKRNLIGLRDEYFPNFSRKQPQAFTGNAFTDELFNNNVNFADNAAHGISTDPAILAAFDEMMANQSGKEYALRHFTDYDYNRFIPQERLNEFYGQYGHRITRDPRYTYPQLNAQLSLGQKVNREVDRYKYAQQTGNSRFQKFKESLDKKLKEATEKYAFTMPQYKGNVQQKIGYASLGSGSDKQQFANQVFGAQSSNVPSGTVFTGSLNTSHNSWMNQIKKVFDYDQGVPQFLGYHDMNTMGYLSNAGYSADEIANYLNTELNDLIRRGKLPKTIERPFVDKKTGTVRIPHYGVRKNKFGGLIKAQEGKEYKGYSDEQLLEMMNNFQVARQTPIFGKPSVFNLNGENNHHGQVANIFYSQEPFDDFLKRKELERKATFKGGGEQYKGSSIVDYLATKGYKGDKAFRKDLAQQYGVEGYDYSAAKNLELLSKLRENEEILNQQQRSFEPVSVETIEQLHQKNKAGLDRHKSLPGRTEAKRGVDINKLNTMLDIASMGYKDKLSQPIVTPEFKLSKGKPSKPFTRTAPSSNNPENVLPEGEYDVTQPKSSQPVSQEEPGFFDYVGGFLMNPLNPVNPLAIAGGYKMANTASNYFNMGKNWINRQYALITGEGDNEKTKSEIKIPQITSSKPTAVTSQKNKLTIEGMPYQEGNAIDMVDKDDRYYTKPLWIDLNNPNLRLGARNRGSRLGNIKSEGFVITPFAKEYGSDYDDDKGTNTIRRYKDSEIIDDKIYGGVDDNGQFYLDYGKNLKGKNLQMADFRDMEISGIAKDKKGRYMYGNATSNKRVAKTAIALDAQGKPNKDLNLLVPKASLKTGHESFGQIGGGRFILASPDLKHKVLISGSLKNIDDDIETFKKATGLKTIKLIPLDNGTFARGLSTKDGLITDKDQEAYDNFNNSGGAAFYLTQKRIGGSILPKAENGLNNTGFQPINFQPQPLTLNPGVATLNNGFSQFNLTANTTIKPFDLGEIGIQDCGEGAIWDPINKKCVPKEGYTQLDNPITNSSMFVKDKFEYKPQSEPIKQLWGQPEAKQKNKSKYLFGDKVGKFAAKYGPGVQQLGKALNTGFALGNFITSNIEYQDAVRNKKRSQRNKLFTDPMVMPQMSGFRGDYVTNTGDFRPNEQVVNKGMFTSNIPGSRIGKFGGLMMQDGGAISEQLAMPETEFSPMVSPDISMSQAPSVSESEGASTTNYKHSGANPMTEKTWDQISKEYSGVKFLGVWGDEKHKRRKSDHNDGNALDIGITDIEQGNKIAERLISEADDKRIKYLIFNKKIWSPEDGWKDYTPSKANGGNPHTSHVHVSFYPYEGNKNVKKSGESISVSHNNPGNIHFGNFTSQWGAEKGASDNNGNVAMFNSLEDGWDAFNKLLFGSDYNNLSILEARNKWVTGKPTTNTDSSKFIASELGVDGNTKIVDLSPEQKIKLASLFIKYEDNRMYKKMKDMKYFEMGGQVNYNEGEEYDLTEDEIRQFLENGGELEFI